MSTFVRRIWCSLIPFKVHVDRERVGGETTTDECDASVSRGGENHVARTLLLIKLLHISPDMLCPDWLSGPHPPRKAQKGLISGVALICCCGQSFCFPFLRRRRRPSVRGWTSLLLWRNSGRGKLALYMCRCGEGSSSNADKSDRQAESASEAWAGSWLIFRADGRDVLQTSRAVYGNTTS